MLIKRYTCCIFIFGCPLTNEVVLAYSLSGSKYSTDRNSMADTNGKSSAYSVFTLLALTTAFFGLSAWISYIAATHAQLATIRDSRNQDSDFLVSIILLPIPPPCSTHLMPHHVTNYPWGPLLQRGPSKMAFYI